MLAKTYGDFIRKAQRTLSTSILEDMALKTSELEDKFHTKEFGFYSIGSWKSLKILLK